MARSLMAAGMEMDKAIRAAGYASRNAYHRAAKKQTRSGNSMGMKHILRALDQALETAEIERKYLRDELEAGSGWKSSAWRRSWSSCWVRWRRPRRSWEQLLGQVEETKAELDKLLETFRERERTWAGEREDMAGELWELRREKGAHAGSGGQPGE